MFAIRGCWFGVEKLVRLRKTPSAIVERQMLPRHTKRTETFLSSFEEAMMGGVRVEMLVDGELRDV